MLDEKSYIKIRAQALKFYRTIIESLVLFGKLLHCYKLSLCYTSKGNGANSTSFIGLLRGSGIMNSESLEQCLIHPMVQ